MCWSNAELISFRPSSGPNGAGTFRFEAARPQPSCRPSIAPTCRQPIAGQRRSGSSPNPAQSDDRAGKWGRSTPKPGPHGRPGGQMGKIQAKTRATWTTGRANGADPAQNPGHTDDRAGKWGPDRRASGGRIGARIPTRYDDRASSTTSKPDW